MTYVNLVLAAGARAFMERAARAGVAGVILPDLPIDEGDDVREQARRAGVGMVPLAAPTTADARLAAIGRRAEGFVYCVVGGRRHRAARSRSATSSRGFLERARAPSSTRRSRWASASARRPDAAVVGAIADGVIVASQLIRLISDAPDPAAAEAAIERFAEEAVAALREGSHSAGQGPSAVQPVR